MGRDLVRLRRLRHRPHRPRCRQRRRRASSGATRSTSCPRPWAAASSRCNPATRCCTPSTSSAGFPSRPLLKLGGPGQAATGKAVSVSVTNGTDGKPVESATVARDGDGRGRVGERQLRLAGPEDAEGRAGRTRSAPTRCESASRTPAPRRAVCLPSSSAPRPGVPSRTARRRPPASPDRATAVATGAGRGCCAAPPATRTTGGDAGEARAAASRRR